MNDALDRGEHMRDETVTMSRDEFLRTVKRAMERAWDSGHTAAMTADAELRNPYRADELEGEG